MEIKKEWFEKNLPSFRARLLGWYRKNGRDLPWRKTSSPYKIWLSEIMLQQTRVDTVIPYYFRFLAMFPTIQALAMASLQEVLKAWEGLGYYSRVRNMHRAANMIVRNYGGEFPRTMQEIRSLPGIGPYTAGAIGSIVFQLPVPVVDGNVIRVLARFFTIDDEIFTVKAKKQFWQFAGKLVPEKNPGDFNQALMEIGALICTPDKPNCAQCPIAGECLAMQHGRQADLPVRREKSPVPHYRIGAGLIWRNGKILIARRPENGLLGGLWEFPGGKKEAGESIRECVLREIGEELHITVRVAEHFMTVKHAYTHFRITMDVFHCHWEAGEPVCRACTDFKWVNVNDLDHFPFPRANKRIVERIMEEMHN